MLGRQGIADSGTHTAATVLPQDERGRELLQQPASQGFGIVQAMHRAGQHELIAAQAGPHAIRG